MKNENIIIILVVITIILAGAVGLMFLQTTNAKEPTEIKITSNETLDKGDGLSIQLTNLNKTAISENVSIVIRNQDGSAAVNETVNTNSKGLASLDLDLESGEYTVDVAFNGNDNFKGSNATQKLTIKEEVKQVYAYKSDGTPMYSQEEVDNYIHSKYGQVNYHIQDNGYINLDDPGYTDDGAKVVKGGVKKDGKTYERYYYENYIMGK